MQIITLLNTDSEFRNLVQYGIAEENYTLSYVEIGEKEYPQVEKDYQVRHINYYKQMKLIKDMVAENKAILMYPTETVKVSRFKGDREKCLQLYNLGYADMEKRKDEIFAFMKKEDQ
jgi:predicted patatin/cPLA2 family phospholipase